jgi:hypothetical protein
MWLLMESEDPMLAQLSTLKEPCIYACDAAETLKEDPNLATDLIEIVLPNERKSTIESSFPSRVKFLTDKLLAQATHCVMEHALKPLCIWRRPSTLQLLPNRPELLRDKLLPIWKKVKAEKLLPNRP